MSKPKPAEPSEWNVDAPVDAFAAWACAEPEGMVIFAGYAPPPFPLSKINPHQRAAQARAAAARPVARKPKPKARRRTRTSPTVA